MEPTQLTAKSVDSKEIEKFNHLAATWWDDAGPMWPLHTLNKLRTGYIVDHLVKHFSLDAKNDTKSSHPLSGLRILDIGCGGGLLSEAMAKRGAQVHAVDISDRNIAIATQHAAALNNPPIYEHTTAEVLHERSESYDVVLNMEVVEHVADLAAFVHTCNALIKPGGLQIISTINRNPISWISAIVGAEYILKWLPKGTHQYRRLVKPEELSKLLAIDGLTEIDSTGVFVNPLTRKMSLRKSKVIGYMIVVGKPGRHIASN